MKLQRGADGKLNRQPDSGKILTNENPRCCCQEDDGTEELYFCGDTFPLTPAGIVVRPDHYPPGWYDFSDPDCYQFGVLRYKGRCYYPGARVTVNPTFTTEVTSCVHNGCDNPTCRLCAACDWDATTHADTSPNTSISVTFANIGLCTGCAACVVPNSAMWQINQGTWGGTYCVPFNTSASGNGATECVWYDRLDLSNLNAGFQAHINCACCDLRCVFNKIEIEIVRSYYPSLGYGWRVNALASVDKDAQGCDTFPETGGPCYIQLFSGSISDPVSQCGNVTVPNDNVLDCTITFIGSFSNPAGGGTASLTMGC